MITTVVLTVLVVVGVVVLNAKKRASLPDWEATATAGISELLRSIRGMDRTTVCRRALSPSVESPTTKKTNTNVSWLSSSTSHELQTLALRALMFEC